MAPSFHQNSNTVCVLDASGQLGSALVKRLLQRGYTVHAAVQEHALFASGELQLDAISRDTDKLKISYADPFDYHSILQALKGCSGLFYTFEPPNDQPNYDEYMVDVEVRAAHNVLEACSQTDTIDKVVFTSSATAVIWKENRRSMELDFDERQWTDVNYCRKLKLWHALSKTLAEKTAWALAMDRGLNMVTINSGLLMTPDLSIKTPYLKGAAEMYEDGVFVTVDLDFLVNAHICIYEDISSYGRHLCFNHNIDSIAAGAKLSKQLTSSAYSISQSLEQDLRIVDQRISNQKLKKFMVEFEG